MKTSTYASFDLQNGKSTSEILCLHISSLVRELKLTELRYFQDYGEFLAKNHGQLKCKNAIMDWKREQFIELHQIIELNI